MRNPRNPDGYFVAPRVAAGAVTAGDVVQRDLTKGEPDSVGLSIHDEVYKARPDVNAIVYARTPEVVAFTGSVKLRPIVNGGAFIGAGLPVFDLGTLDQDQPILANPALGRGVATALGKSAGVLLPGHGFVLTAASVYNLADRAYQSAAPERKNSAAGDRAARQGGVSQRTAGGARAGERAGAARSNWPCRRSRLGLLDSKRIARLRKGERLYFLLARSTWFSLISCSTFSLLVQKFSVRSSLPSEYVRHAEVHGLLSTCGSSIVYWYSR